MPTWPASLPDKFPRRVSGVAIQDGKEELPPDAGPPLVTRRFTATSQVLEFELILTTTQEATLETFGETTCSGWTAEFDWTNSVGSNGLKYFTFVGRPIYDWIGNKRIARIRLRTRPGTRV